MTTKLTQKPLMCPRLQLFLTFRQAVLCGLAVASVIGLPDAASSDETGYSVEQVTFGPKHHFFGYIGHVKTIPWNASGRLIVALETDLLDRLPGPDDAARIVLLDVENNFALRAADVTRAWNPQQGTMLYWNPEAADTQFFFNDRDPETGEIFTVLYDVAQGRRVREYRFPGSPVANSGVAQNGGSFLALNYARMARLRPVTGYAGARDWTDGTAAPEDDGVFLVDVKTGKRRLLVSLAKLRDALRGQIADIEKTPLFINHTLFNRDDDRIYFYVRGNFRSRLPRVDVPFTTDLNGNLLRQQHVGGHPEWEFGHALIGASDGKQVLYDTDRAQIVGRLGQPGDFPNPGGDVALSPDGRRLVNGHGNKDPGENHYTVLDRDSGRLIRFGPFDRGPWTSGPLRIDPAPCWDRTGRQIMISAIASDGSRQMFLISLRDR